MAALLASACGKSSHDDLHASAGAETGGAAGTSPNPAGAGTRSGGAAGTVGAAVSGTGGGGETWSGGGTSNGGGSGSANAGAGTAGGQSGGSAGAPAGGSGGADADLGFQCGSAEHCDVGQACVRCMLSQDNSVLRCVPHPIDQPTGYAAAMADCLNSPTSFDDCDGPEDCAPGEYCVAMEGAQGLSRCRSAPATGLKSCCFACDALTNCTLCKTNADCPASEKTCAPVLSGPASLKGCQ